MRPREATSQAFGGHDLVFGFPSRAEVSGDFMGCWRVGVLLSVGRLSVRASVTGVVLACIRVHLRAARAPAAAPWFKNRERFDARGANSFWPARARALVWAGALAPAAARRRLSAPAATAALEAAASQRGAASSARWARTCSASCWPWRREVSALAAEFARQGGVSLSHSIVLFLGRPRSLLSLPLFLFSLPLPGRTSRRGGV